MHDDTFSSLVEAVERQGGELLAETHYEYPIMYKIPGNGGRVKATEVPSTGCGQECLFMVPYEPEPSSGGVTELERVKVCAVDDRMDLWPRFASEMGE